MADLNNGIGKMKSIYRMSDPQPDWNQNDPSQPAYIKNKEGAQEVRPIYINGESFLSNNVDSGPVNFAAGRNITIATDGNTVVISAKNSGTGGSCDCPEYIEGNGIDIVETPYGQRVVSLEPGSINTEHIGSISMSKIVQDENEILILNGGKANGYN